MPPACPECASPSIKRRGTRIKKLETVQLWQCKSCARIWTPSAPDAQDKTFTPRIIKDVLISYGLGRSLSQTKDYITDRRGAKRSPSTATIARYIDEYARLLSITRIRDDLFATRPAITTPVSTGSSASQERKQSDGYRPTNVLKRVRLYHRQIYEFVYHRAKLDRLRRDPEHAHLTALAPFLENLPTLCPHELFKEAPAGTVRASALGKSTLYSSSDNLYDPQKARVMRKQNVATAMAAFIVPTVGDNKARHPELQRFFLTCDSSTIAVEVPIWLSEADILALEKKYRRRLIPYTIDPKTDRPLPRTLTGHIDFLQVRNGALHILDYKPGSREDRPVAQLTLYALALSFLIARAAHEHNRAHPAGSPAVNAPTLFDIKCAWFDEHEYNEFFPRTIIEG